MVKLSLCFFMVAAALSFLTGLIPASADAVSKDQLTTLTSWTSVSTRAKEHGVPIILLVEQRNCGYCQRLKRDLFRPLANDPSLAGRAVFVSVRTDYDEPLLEKEGKKISGFEFAELHDANTTPTVLFLDHTANELQQRVVGYIAEEGYAADLREKIDASIGALSDYP